MSSCGHSHIIIKDQGTPATCLQPGLTDGYHCEICNEVIVAQESIAATGHHIVKDLAVLPTCTEPGLTEGSHCDICGQTIVAQETIKPLGHHFVIDESVSPTCTEQGKTTGLHCDICGEILIEQTTIEQVSHNYVFDSVCMDFVEGFEKPAIFKCSLCGNTKIMELDSSSFSLPVLSFTGDLSGLSKNTKTKIQVKYEDNNEIVFDCDATLKLQGSSSLSFPKKNYNMVLYKSGTNYDKKNKVTLVDSWGKQSKYTLKANWVDASQMRNIVSAKLYGQVVKSRDIDDEFSKLVNGGAIDGYPVVIYENGVYHGLYTLNIPKDDWLFGMDGDESDRMAFVSTGDWTDSVSLKEHIPAGFGNGWELEYSCTDETDTGNDWIVDSLNNMIDFLNNNDGEAFINGIDTYIDVDRAIDQMLFTFLIKGNDNISKNILWVTYDGTKWQPSMYDMDGVFGLLWNGTNCSTDAFYPKNSNVLWKKLWLNFNGEILARYSELRNTIMSKENIMAQFISFNALIPAFVRDLEKEKWPEIPLGNQNYMDFFDYWVSCYLDNMDKAIIL